jgi:hypothetical protein
VVTSGERPQVAVAQSRLFRPHISLCPAAASRFHTCEDRADRWRGRHGVAPPPPGASYGRDGHQPGFLVEGTQSDGRQWTVRALASEIRLSHTRVGQMLTTAGVRSDQLND